MIVHAIANMIKFGEKGLNESMSSLTYFSSVNSIRAHCRCKNCGDDCECEEGEGDCCEDEEAAKPEAQTEVEMQGQVPGVANPDAAQRGCCA